MNKFKATLNGRFLILLWGMFLTTQIGSGWAQTKPLSEKYLKEQWEERVECFRRDHGVPEFATLAEEIVNYFKQENKSYSENNC